MLTEASRSERISIAKALFDENGDNLNSFSTFFSFYDSITRPRAHHAAIVQVHDPVLGSHEDILGILSDLKANHQSTYIEFKQRLRKRWQKSLDNEIDHAINIAVHLMVMIDCTIVDSHSEEYEIDGYRPAKWQQNERFSDFVSSAFPLDDEADRLQILEAQRNCNMLKAWKLRKRAHVTFKPTDDLREHLLYDSRENSVRLFRHTAFLKARLRRSEAISFETLPPQLLLETLHSLQHILFPSFDGKSLSLLDRLVHGKHSSLDRDCLIYDGLCGMPANFEYRYWGGRLMKLHRLVRNPKPQNRLEQWIDRHTTERNALYVALIGLFLAVLFGFLGLIVGIIQTWITYKAWKYPQPVPSG